MLSMLCLNCDNRFNNLDFYSYFVSVYERTVGTYNQLQIYCPDTFFIRVTWAYYGTLKQNVPVKLGVSKCDVNTITNLMKKECYGRPEYWIYPHNVLRETSCSKFENTDYNLVVRYSCIQSTKPGNLTSSNFEFQELKLLSKTCYSKIDNVIKCQK